MMGSSAGRVQIKDQELRISIHEEQKKKGLQVSDDSFVARLKLSMMNN